VAADHLKDLHDYLYWFSEQLESSGGELDRDILEYTYPLGDDEDYPSRLYIAEHRLTFWDGTYLTFRVTVNDDLISVTYNFDLRTPDNRLVFRKDKQPGHEREVGGLEHIHRNPSDEDEVEPYPEVDLEDVLDQISSWRQTGSPFR
jgi:hypothetical protein